jgi:flavin-dependent dehydrogenase
LAERLRKYDRNWKETWQKNIESGNRRIHSLLQAIFISNNALENLAKANFETLEKNQSAKGCSIDTKAVTALMMALK